MSTPRQSELGTRQSLGKVLTNRPEWGVAIVVAVSFVLLLSRLWVGDLLNSYPYMSDDSFDWVTQGVALVELVSGEDGSTWPILRPPGFVMVWALDYLFEPSGLVFLLCQSAALATAALFVTRYARLKGAGNFAAVAAGLAVPFSLLGFYSLWILSDAIASSLMTLSAIFALERLRTSGALAMRAQLRLLLPAILLGGLASITQTYGMIPVLVICSVYAAGRVLEGRQVHAWGTPIVAAILTGALGFGVQKIWAAVIPHGMQPAPFSLVKPSLGMLDFYSSVWPLAFGVFVPILVWTAWQYICVRRLPGLDALSLLATVGAFATLSFSYQWPESRMTYIYVPLVIVTVLALVAGIRNAESADMPLWVRPALGATFCAALGMTFLVVPGEYWRPSLAQTRIAPHQTWIAEAIKTRPVDRYELRIVCDGMDDVCPRADAGPQSSPYRDMMLREYKRRLTETPSE